MRPIVLFGVSVEAEELFQLLIGTFRLSIGSGVKCHRGVLFDAKRLTYFGGEATHEPGISVVNKSFREPHTFEHVFQVELGDSFSCYCFVARHEDDCLSTVVVGNREYRVKTI